MFGFTKKIIAAVCLLALYPGEYGAYCSNVEFDAGYQKVKGSMIFHKSFEGSKKPKIPTLGGNARDIKIRLLIEVSKKISPGILRLVCKDWRDVIDTGTPDDKGLRYSTIGPVWKQCIHAWYGVLGHEDTWQKILTGELVYKPNPENDVGTIILKISDLANPFADNFDISGCGKTYKNLCISMGLRKGKKDSNKGKCEVRLLPRFLGEHKLESSASYIALTFTLWSSNYPVAVIFQWGEHGSNDSYNYCYRADYALLAKNTLGQMYVHESKTVGFGCCGQVRGTGPLSCFTFKFA